MAQVKTEHRKGEPSKTTFREICRYYINGKGQCEVIERKMEVIPELKRNGFTGDLYGLAPLTMFKAMLRDRSNSVRLQGKNLNQLTKLTHQTSLYRTNYRLKEVLDGVMEIIFSNFAVITEVLKRFEFVLFADYKFTKSFSISVIFCNLFHTRSYFFCTNSKGGKLQ